jgi:2-polyprenyl-3-methyl-5-hydroxy-6-metoxy-1,4-benzoquinol methylase
MNILRAVARRAVLNLKSEIDTISVNDPDEYEQLQRRAGVVEYVHPRFMIMSTILYLRPYLQELTKSRGVDASGISILDAGARDGWTVSLLNDLGFSASGIELVGDVVENARARGRNVAKGDIQQLQFDPSTFDVVFCRHTLEHTTNPGLAMKEMVRVTKSGGLIFVSLPIERAAHGKHTTAVPNLRLLKQLSVGLPVSVIDVRRSKSTGLIIPDGDEALMLLRRQ